jgi:prepilin peptidase CpaA
MLAFEIALATFCAGGVMALAMVIHQGRWRDFVANMRILLRPLCMRAVGMPSVREPLPAGSVGGMPYGLAIAVATCLMLWIRHG